MPSFEEIAGNRFARGKTNAVHEAVELGPGGRQVSEHALDLLVAGHVAVEHQLGVELGGKVGDAVLEAFADVAKGEFGALLVAGACNAVGNGAVGQHAGNQQLLAG